VPEGWTEVFSRSKPGRSYFRHERTGRSSWRFAAVLPGGSQADEAHGHAAGGRTPPGSDDDE
jgi:hypothetical protein